MAPLQKRALYSLIIGLVLTAGFVAVLVAQGDVTAFENDANLRYIMYAVVVGVPLCYGILVAPIMRKPRLVDERDKRIIDRSNRAQWLAVIFSLVAWTIGLTEVYHDRGQVPVAFMTLIFFSTLIVSTLAQSIGILVGYSRLERDV